MKLLDLFKISRLGDQVPAGKGTLQMKYECFKRILSSNNTALGIIADLEHMIYKGTPFSLGYVVNQTALLIREVFSMVEDLNALTGAKYEGLFPVTEQISETVLAELRKRKKIEQSSLVLPLEMLSLENLSEVGGKAANLGEVYNRANLPVPAGFAVTAYACHHFLDHNQLVGWIETRLKDLDVNDTETLISVCREIQGRVLSAGVPFDLEQAILQSVRTLKHKLGGPLRLSVRSSATSEDSEASFAGQHSTVLNVTEEQVIPAYKEVVSSAFNPRAIFYRRTKGYPDQDVVMSVACLLMVDAKVSGVLYTVDPNDSRHSVILISAVWGLAAKLVDEGSSADFFQVEKKSGKLEAADIAEKESVLRPDWTDGLKEEILNDERRNSPCLQENQINALVEHARKLEEHYGYPLDIEWAIDKDDHVLILQARPLHRSRGAEEEKERKSEDESLSLAANHQVLLRGGASASDGTASGPAFVIKSDETLHRIPEGAIVIAKQTSPLYVAAMGRIQAIVTDVGTVTGHMASVAREFRIPTLVGTGNATETISNGQLITVDATNRTVYRGRVESLLSKKKPINPMKGSPIYKTVQTAIKRIAPLNLFDPRDSNFNPEGCQTLHDLIRFSHEIAMREMFRISDEVHPDRSGAVPLRIPLPMKILVIDLGGGLSIREGAEEATFDDITSYPFKSLLKGMTHKDVSWTRHSGVSLRGFGTLVAESLLRDPLLNSPMGGPSYAVVAANYLNFSARLGYHFVTVDTFCGPRVNDNYIIFYFKGGAADIARRSRRAQLITLVLRWVGFSMEQKGDMVRGVMKKYQCGVLEEKLDIIGRLLGSVNLLDMALHNDKQVEWYADRFLEGNYTFQPEEGTKDKT
ncbi:MAG: pyruvate, phosphate dikinase [Desulfobacteraceae bacterium]|nr:MAG: pyruvate, phosphate dikinase [Desulfobacteraceae bacterium]